MLTTRLSRFMGVGVLAGLLFLGACRQASKEPTGAGSLNPDEVSRLEASHLKVTVSGPVSFTWEDDVDLRIVVVNDPEVTSLRFLSVGIHDMKALEGGAQFRIAFDLAGRYGGPGTYQLPAIGGAPATLPSVDPRNPDPNPAAEGLSRIYLTYFKLKADADGGGSASIEVAHQFENVLEPCALEVGKNEQSGKLSCPRVADAKGTTVNVVMEWRSR